MKMTEMGPGRVERLERCERCHHYRPITDLEWSGAGTENAETQLYRCKDRDACTERARRRRTRGER